MGEPTAEERAGGLNPGIYPRVPYSVYESIDAARHSVLKLFDRSAAHARQAIIAPKDPTEALDVGNAAHTAILEPGRFETDFAKAPAGDKRTKEVRAAWQVFEADLRGRIPLRAGEYDRVLGMRDSLWSGAYPLAEELMRGRGANEVVALWEDLDTELLCKARVDRVTSWDGYTTLIDLKTTTDASPQGFGRQIARYLYHVQAAYYLDGFDTLDPRPRRFLFIAIEKEPPYCVTVHELLPNALELGRTVARKFLDEYALAKKTGRWPGYPPDLCETDLPLWVYKKEAPDEY